MSKIEEALKKAGKGQSPGMGLSTVVTGDTQKTDLVPADNRSHSALNTIAERRKEIAMMSYGRLFTREELEKKRLIFSGMRNEEVTNIFRDIRTKIIQSANGRNPVIIVTSVIDGGGTSFLAANIGAAFAFDESKTALLVDCSLKRPSLYDILCNDDSNLSEDQPEPLGLIDFLAHDEVDAEEIIYKTGIKRLRLVPGGRDSEVSTEYFSSNKMRKFLDDLWDRFPDRYIIIDAPPVLESADTRILGEMADMVILVVPYARVTSSKIETAIKQIGREKIVGIIINKEPSVPDVLDKAI